MEDLARVGTPASGTPMDLSGQRSKQRLVACREGGMRTGAQPPDSGVIQASRSAPACQSVSGAIRPTCRRAGSAKARPTAMPASTSSTTCWRVAIVDPRIDGQHRAFATATPPGSATPRPTEDRPLERSVPPRPRRGARTQPSPRGTRGATRERRRAGARTPRERAPTWRSRAPATHSRGHDLGSRIGPGGHAARRPPLDLDRFMPPADPCHPAPREADGPQPGP